MPYAAVNGLNMYYGVHGAGPPLLLLRGSAGSIPTKWIPFFTTQFRVIAMEQMGHERRAQHMRVGVGPLDAQRASHDNRIVPVGLDRRVITDHEQKIDHVDQTEFRGRLFGPASVS